MGCPFPRRVVFGTGFLSPARLHRTRHELALSTGLGRCGQRYWMNQRERTIGG